MIKNIVWDMGNVLADFNVKKIIQGMPIKEENRDRILKEVFQSPDWIRLDAGDLYEPWELVQAVWERTPEDLHEDVKTAVEHWYEYTMEPMKETEALVRRLKAAGYHQYVLSNASIQFREYQDTIPAFSLMDGLYVSAFHKMMKPEKRIYEGMLSEFGLKAEECVFIDDNHVNVAGAMIQGMKGIVYHGDALQLEEELKKLGVNF